MRDTGYGSDSFLRAFEAAQRCRAIDGGGVRARWARLRAGSLLVARYRRQLPSVTIELTSSQAGRMIGEHFAIREDGKWRYRRAQGVLALPAEFADYMRGRHRQAVRTNVSHARRAGYTVTSYAVDCWFPGTDDSRAAHLSTGPVERWTVLDADGVIVADSILSVDENAALLQGLVSFSSNARWLLHTAIVERLCGDCDLLLTNSDDAYLMGVGNQHFQRLLGYQISRLRFSRAPRPAVAEIPPHPAALPWQPAALPCGIAPGVAQDVAPALTLS